MTSNFIAFAYIGAAAVLFAVLIGCLIADDFDKDWHNAVRPAGKCCETCPCGERGGK